MPKINTTKTKKLDKRSTSLQSEPPVSSFCHKTPGAKLGFESLQGCRL